MRIIPLLALALLLACGHSDPGLAYPKRGEPPPLCPRPPVEFSDWLGIGNRWLTFRVPPGWTVHSHTWGARTENWTLRSPKDRSVVFVHLEDRGGRRGGRAFGTNCTTIISGYEAEFATDRWTRQLNVVWQGGPAAGWDLFITVIHASRNSRDSLSVIIPWTVEFLPGADTAWDAR